MYTNQRWYIDFEDDLALLEQQELSSIHLEWNALGTPVDLPWGDGFMSYASFRIMGNVEWGVTNIARIQCGVRNSI